MWLNGDTVFISSHDLQEKLRNDRKNISLEIYDEFKEYLEQVYLVLVSETHHSLNYTACKWKMLINGFNISRVLRPYKDIIYKDRKYLFLIYDLTSVKHLLTDINRVSIEYQGDHTLNTYIASLISTYSVFQKKLSEEVETSSSIYLDLNAKVLEANTSATLSFPRETSRDIDITLYMIPLTLSAEVSVGDKSLTLRGVEEIDLRISQSDREIPIRVLRGVVMIPMTLMQERIFREPNYSIKEVYLDSTDPNVIRSRVEIDNIGDIDLREILLVVMSRGRTIASKKMSGSERSAVIEFPRKTLGPEDRRLTYRVIWNWAGKRYFVSKDISLER